MGPVAAEENPHDYTQWTEVIRDRNREVIDEIEHEEPGIPMMVRPGHTFGHSPGGTVVWVTQAEVDKDRKRDPERRQLMTVEEARELQAEQERKEAERLAKKKHRPIKAAVDAFLAELPKIAEERVRKQAEARARVAAAKAKRSV